MVAPPLATSLVSLLHFLLNSHDRPDRPWGISTPIDHSVCTCTPRHSCTTAGLVTAGNKHGNTTTTNNNMNDMTGNNLNDE